MEGFSGATTQLEPLMRSMVIDVTEDIKKEVFSGVWGMLGYSIEVSETKKLGEKTFLVYPHFEKDKSAIQKKIAFFFDSKNLENITYKDVKIFIEAFNTVFPDLQIDEDKDLLEGIKRAIDGLLPSHLGLIRKAIPGLPYYFENREAIQKELAPFFSEPDKITYHDVLTYIAALNETFPDYAIDESKGLLSEIRRTKHAMIERGERGFLNGVGIYAYLCESGRNTLNKIEKYMEDRSDLPNDIGYQQEMLSWFKFFHGCRES